MAVTIQPQNRRNEFVEMVIRETEAAAQAPTDKKAREQFSISQALRNLPRFGERLASLISGVFEANPHVEEERYLFLPGGAKGVLFLDIRGHLIKVNEPMIFAHGARTQVRQPATFELLSFQSVEFLTGGTPAAGKDAVSYIPKYKKGVIEEWFKQTLSGASFASGQQRPVA